MIGTTFTNFLQEAAAAGAPAAGLTSVPPAGFAFADILGYVFGAGALAASLGVVVRRDAVVAAMNLVLAFFCLSGVYLLLGFPFLAAIQILVYAGAITVLFLFVIMLLGVSTLARAGVNTRTGMGAAIALAVLVEGVVVAIELASRNPSAVVNPVSESIPGVAFALFNGKYVLAFELTGVILLAAMVGVVVLARRDLRERTPADFAREHAFDPRPLVRGIPTAALPDGLSDSVKTPAPVAPSPTPLTEPVS